MSHTYQRTAKHRADHLGQRSVWQISSRVSATIGTEFFESLVTNLAKALNADCVYLGEFVGGQAEQIRTLAASPKGLVEAGSDHDLVGCVAAQAVTGDTWSCTRGVLKKFPDDALLRQMGAQACIVVPLMDAKQQTLGIMLAVFRHPIENARPVKSLLEMFAPRATAELQRKQSDAALRESEQRYHAFISQNVDAMWRIEFERPIPTDLPEDDQIQCIYDRGYLAEANDALARLLGYSSAKQIIGLTFEALARRADPRIKEDLRTAIRSGYRFATVERKPLDVNGHSRHILRSEWCVVEEGMLVRIWGTLRDITELKKVEEALQASERRLSELLESVHLLTVMWDGEGEITYCNDYFLRLTGWQAGELAGKNWFDLMVPTTERDKVRNEFASTRVSSPAPHHFESTLLGKDGRSWLIAWESTIIHDSNGQVTGLGGVGRDITAYRVLKEEQYQSQKFASMNGSVSRLVDDFTSLLTVISSYSVILFEGRPETDPEYLPLKEIKDAADEGVALAQQLLAFSPHLQLHPTLLDLNTLLQEVERTIQPFLPEDVTLHMELGPSLGLVRADASLMREVLLNLTANAIEAMPGGGNLTLHSSNTELDQDPDPSRSGFVPGPYVLLTVSDTGSGISPQVQTHLFEPFFTTKSGRTGLGLATVYAIVEQSGGHVKVDTQPGIGTRFQIYLPRTQTQS